MNKTVKNQLAENVIIIGGGPAGLSAAIYLARAGLSPLVFAGFPPGGQMILTRHVENFPGHMSILGAELIKNMRNQAKKFGARIVDENVKMMNTEAKQFEVFLKNATDSVTSFPPASAPSKTPVRAVGSPSTCATCRVFSRTILIATGAKALWLELESEKRLRGKGVSACAICDGFFFRDKVVGVVGGGDAALEEALTLTRFAKKVFIIHRRDSFRASKVMQERVLKHPKIEVIWNAEVKEVLGENRVEGIRLTDRLLKVDGLFVAIGHKPNTEIFKNKVEMDERGYIITKIRNPRFDREAKRAQSAIRNFLFETSIPGIFAAGDCVDYVYRQASTAAGMGVAAALEIQRWLENNF
jgi:thioredoxin reductase (NADPH)